MFILREDFEQIQQFFIPNWQHSLHILPDYSKPFRSVSLLCKSNQIPRTHWSTSQTQCRRGTFCCCANERSFHSVLQMLADIFSNCDPISCSLLVQAWACQN